MSLPFLFPKNLLPCKIFSGTLIIFGVLGAYFTRPSPPKIKEGFLPFFCFLVKKWWGLAYGENLLANLSFRTKQWTPTVYRVGRTGESPHIYTKKLIRAYLAPFFHIKNSVTHDKVRSFIFLFKRTQSTTLLHFLDHNN